MNKLNLDSIMTDEFGKLPQTIDDAFKKVEEEHEEMKNEYLKNDKEKLFSETLDSIQSGISFLVRQCKNLEEETIASYLDDWVEKQENRKHKYLKN